MTGPVLPFPRQESEYARRVRRLLMAANIRSAADRAFVDRILAQQSLDSLSGEQWAIINKILRQANRLECLQRSVL